MKLLDSISSFANYETKCTNQTIHKIATNPSAVKKVFQIVSKMLAAWDLYKDKDILSRPITDAMKGTTELVEFYGSFKDIMFWINPFSRESLDQDALLQSLRSSLSASHRNTKESPKQKKFAERVVADVMSKEDYYSKGEVLEALRISLEKRGCQSAKAQQIAARVLIQQKSRPVTSLISMACFTIADLGTNIMVLKKWGILDPSKVLDLSKLAAQLGSQSKVFLFVVNLGVDTVLGTVASVGSAISIGGASYRLIVNGGKYYRAQTNPFLMPSEEKEKVGKELKNATLDFISSGADFINAATPLVFTLNPPVLIGLAIVAKGTGLICILVR
jgi:hypothetical protein